MKAKDTTVKLDVLEAVTVSVQACPVCGSVDLELDELNTPTAKEGTEYDVRVVCTSCGIRGPLSWNSGLAARQWNGLSYIAKEDT